MKVDFKTIKEKSNMPTKDKDVVAVITVTQEQANALESVRWGLDEVARLFKPSAQFNAFCELENQVSLQTEPVYWRREEPKTIKSLVEDLYQHVMEEMVDAAKQKDQEEAQMLWRDIVQVVADLKNAVGG